MKAITPWAGLASGVWQDLHSPSIHFRQHAGAGQACSFLSLAFIYACLKAGECIFLEHIYDTAYGVGYGVLYAESGYYKLLRGTESTMLWPKVTIPQCVFSKLAHEHLSLTSEKPFTNFRFGLFLGKIITKSKYSGTQVFELWALGVMSQKITDPQSFQ